MAVTYLLAPIPKWIIIGNDGLTAGGAKLYTRSSKNPTVDKPVYRDAAGTIPWTNPIIFDANGTSGPFYWKSDSSDLTDNYYLEAFDSDNNLLWTITSFFPPGSGGGGGSSTTYLPLKNMIANNVFIDHIDDTANPTNTTNLVICPSNHQGFTPSDRNAVIGDYGAVGADIRFVKNNTNATDKISFVNFTIGADALENDVTPVQYLRYECTNAPSGETYKAFQFPITHKVNNLQEQPVTFSLWAKVTTTPVTLTLFERQYFGSGGSPSTEVRQSVGTMALTSSWQKFVLNFSFSDTAAKTLGSCGDDAVYLQLGIPLGTICDIQFTKPSLYLGTINALADFDTYDEIDTITQSVRTGDTKFSMKSTCPGGWVPLADSAIGSASSSANGRANIDTFPLYKTLWDNVSDTFCPVSTGRGASAIEDFSADKSMALTRALGRVLTGANSLGLSQTISLVDTSTNELTISSTSGFATGTPILITSTSSLPSPLQSGVVYYSCLQSATKLKVSLSPDFAYASVVIDLTTAGSGTLTLSSALGAYFGEGYNILSISQIPSHNHSATITPSTLSHSTPAGGGTDSQINSAVNSSVSVSIGNTGGGLPHNTFQPSLAMNLFMKL